MFHIKIWLGVIFFGIVTIMVWTMQPVLVDKVAQEKDRLRPILAGQRLEVSLRKFYASLGKKAQKVAASASLRKAVKGVDYDAKDHLSKVMSYEKVNKEIFRRFKFYQKLNRERETVYIVSRDGRTLFRSDRAGKFDFDKDRLPDIPHLNDALRGRVRTGIWNIDKSSSFVAAAPVLARKRGKKKPEIMAALLYAMRFDDSVFNEIKGAVPKKSRMVLFTASKKTSGDSTLAPIAYNVSGKKQGFMRGWFKKRAYDYVMEKYYNGMNRDLLKATIQEVNYTYMVGIFPAELSIGNIGYALLVPVPNRFLKINQKNFYESGGPRIFALVGLILVFLLATWLSGAEIFYFRRVLPRLQTAPQDEFPDIPTKGLSRPWRELADSINKIFSMIRERGLGDSDLKPQTAVVESGPDAGRVALSYLTEDSSEEEIYGQMSDEEVKSIAASFIGIGGEESQAPSGPTLSLEDLNPSAQQQAAQQQAAAQQQTAQQQYDQQQQYAQQQYAQQQAAAQQQYAQQQYAQQQYAQQGQQYPQQGQQQYAQQQYTQQQGQHPTDPSNKS